MKGIVLAAGKGTRLYPLTFSVSKALLPIYDKPMIYYPISSLMISGIREILVVTAPEHAFLYKKMLGNGSQFGISISYEIQEKANGIASVFSIGKNFIGKSKVCLALGDNIFHGSNFEDTVKNAYNLKSGATVLGCFVNNPENFGVVSFDSSRKVLDLEEKPKDPKSNYIVPGLYFYDNKVIDIASKITPSARGELEITSVNSIYLKKDSLNLNVLDKDTLWFDTGSVESINTASTIIKEQQKKIGKKISCLEEIAYKKGWISKKELEKNIKIYNNSYGDYLKNLL